MACGMLRLGSLLLTGVLLGVPRALDTRAFGALRSVYVDVSPQAPELEAFGRELERALAGAAYALVAHPWRATAVVEVRSATTARMTDGRSCEAVVMAVRERDRTQPLTLHYAPEQRATAARALLTWLDSARTSEPEVSSAASWRRVQRGS